MHAVAFLLLQETIIKIIERENEVSVQLFADDHVQEVCTRYVHEILNDENSIALYASDFIS